MSDDYLEQMMGVGERLTAQRNARVRQWREECPPDAEVVIPGNPPATVGLWRTQVGAAYAEKGLHGYDPERLIVLPEALVRELAKLLRI